MKHYFRVHKYFSQFYILHTKERATLKRKTFMHLYFLVLLLILSVITYGQTGKWQLSFLIQPENTFHKGSYRWNTEDNDKTTFNTGIATLFQYNINKKLFVSSGAAYISRTLHTANFLNQAALPPPRQSFTKELVTTKSVSYRIVSIPALIGYNFFSTNGFKSFITTGISGNYLLNTYYQSNFSNYDGAYKKNYLQGYSVTCGIGSDFKLFKNIQATTSLSYALLHHVKDDEYIQDREGNGLNLKHNYLNLGIGVKFPL